MEAVDTIASQSIERIAGVWRKAAVHTSYSPPASSRDSRPLREDDRYRG